jgi:hypothetical protein
MIERSRKPPRLPWWLRAETAAESSAAVVVLAIAGMSGPHRVLIVAWFLALIPGTSVLRRFLPTVCDTPGLRLLLAVAISLAFLVAAAQLMVLIRFWHPEAALIVGAIALLIEGLHTCFAPKGPPLWPSAR